MAWRLHLSNQAIGRLDLLPGEPALLAAWTRRDRVTFFDIATGVQVADYTLRFIDANDRQGEHWVTFVTGLAAPNKAHLPYVQVGQVEIHTSADGKLRLYRVNEANLYLEANGREIKLEADANTEFVAAALDRDLGTIAALDASGKLHIFQQHIRVGAFDIGLQSPDGWQPLIAISDGGQAIFISNGEKIVLTNSGGTVVKEMNVHYFMNAMVCSPDGKRLLTSDIESGVVRVYQGDDLLPTHQRHAIDLLMEATQVQLLADLPPLSVALSALALNDAGTLAFAISGVLCVTDVAELDVLPRPQPLF